MLVIGREHTDVQLTEYNKRKGVYISSLYPDPKRKSQVSLPINTFPEAT